MKFKQTLSRLLGFAMLAGLTINLNAQVTLGSVEKPENGAVLQLKNIPEVSDGAANATKGLSMPRVELTDINNLFPMFPEVPLYNKSVEDPIHTGLMVYNVNEALFNGDGAGLYSWDGSKWHPLGQSRSIFANSNELYLSEKKPVLETVLSTIPEGLPWQVSTNNAHDLCSYTASREDNKTKLCFERNATAAIYDNKIYTFTLENSDKHVDIKVCHINLTINKNIIKVGENGTISSSSIVSAAGGDGKWFVKEYSKDVGFNWTVPPHNNGGRLTFQLGAVAQSGTTEGSIIVAHENDHDYTKEIKILQNKDYILLPAFDYLLIQYQYGKKDIAGKPILPQGVPRVDLDTATEFACTGVTGVDNRPVGWSFVPGVYTDQSIVVNGQGILFWPGDNQHDGYESVYANMTALVGKRDTEGNLKEPGVLPLNSPREFDVHMYANWYVPEFISQMAGFEEVSIIITLYRGGQMQKLGLYDYENIPKDGVAGELVFGPKAMKEKVDKAGQSNHNLNFRDGNHVRSYTKMIRLEYDKEDNTGVLTRLTQADVDKCISGTTRTYSTPIDPLPNETKEAYGKRIDEYRRMNRSLLEE